jgi:hypothetical protein
VYTTTNMSHLPKQVKTECRSRVAEVDAIIQHVVNGWSELTMWQHLKPTDPGSTGVSPRA